MTARLVKAALASICSGTASISSAGVTQRGAAVRVVLDGWPSSVAAAQALEAELGGQGKQLLWAMCIRTPIIRCRALVGVTRGR